MTFLGGGIWCHFIRISKKGMRCQSSMALNRASDVSAVNWLPPTHVKCYPFSRMVIRLFPAVEIRIKHSCLYNK